MRRGLIPAGALAFVGFFVCTAVVFSADGDIVINEIGAYEGAGHEWIEIWNRGTGPVDLCGWKFWEDGSNHGMAVSSTDSIVEAGEYAAICQDDGLFLVDHPAFPGSIFDSSWGSLNESGEEIGLKNSGGDFIEQFSYIAAPGQSLERVNPYEAVYDDANWREHLAGNTVGLINSVFATSSGTETPTTTPTTTPPIVTPATTTIDWGKIKINEFVSNPETGNEWVELFNAGTSSIDLSGCVLCDSRETGCRSVTGTIPAGGWLFSDLFTAIFLNNDADSAILKNLDNETVDRVDYIAVFAPKKSQALARRTDGADADLSSDWVVTTSLTPGTANIITAPVVPVSGGGGSVPTVAVNPMPTTSPTTSNAAYRLIINEILPNPAGSDNEAEFIEIINLGGETADLNGWKISDGVKSFGLSGSLAPEGLTFWLRSKTGISLNNTSKEEVKIISPQGEVVDKITYDSAPEDESYARTASGTYLWTASPTLGQSNIFTRSGSGIVWKISAPSTAGINEMVVFNADDSADERGGALSVRWIFDDGVITEGAEVARSFSTSGVHTVTAYATSTLGSFGQKTISLSVGTGLSLSDPGINICEIFPNPKGADVKEFIELCNFGDSPVDLNGWNLKVKNKQFIIPDGTVAAPGAQLLFYRTATGLVLDNLGGKVELADRDGNVADWVKYGKGAEETSYMYDNAEWRWVDEPTPGTANIFLASEVKNISAVKPAVNKKSGVAYRAMTIDEARQEDLDNGVIVRGVVAVLPGIFGSQYFYIFDGTAGVQVYQYKKDFPELAIGDVVEVAGIVSNAGGMKRIKTKNSLAIDILETNKSVPPVYVVLSEISEENTGSLVGFTGEITEIKTNYMFVDDGAGEIKVYFKKGAVIDKKIFKEGSGVDIVGVAEIANGEVQIWPRSDNDIMIGVTTTKSVQGEKIESDNNSKKTAEKYFIVTLGGLSVVILGLFFRTKAVLLKSSAGRIIASVAEFFRRR